MNIFRMKNTKMTEGSALPLILQFAIPIMLGNLLQMLYNMVDTAVVGRGIGSDALAAVGTTGPVTQLLLGLMIGLSNGMSVVIAQCFGSGNEKQTKLAITNGIRIMTLVTITITIIGLLGSRALFHLIHTPSSLIDDAVVYASILFFGTVASAAYNFEAGILRAFGNSMVPLLFLALTSLMNVVLDLTFVIVLNFGIAGAAWATVISQGISALLCLLYLRKNVSYVKFTKDDWQTDRSLIEQHLRVGIPNAFFGSLLAISFLILQSALNSLGAQDMAAYTSASKMDSLVYQVLGAFGTAISTFTAQNYGNGNMERVHEGVRKSLKITIGISLFLTLFVYLFGNAFMRLFVGPEETYILSAGKMYMRITSSMYIVLGINYIVRFTLTGVGKTIIPMLVGITEILTRTLVTYLLVYRIGFTGMAFASPACWITSTLLCVLCYRPMMKSAEKAKQNQTV